MNKRIKMLWLLVVFGVVVAIIDGIKLAEAGCNPPPSGPAYDLAVTASADKTLILVGDSVHFSYTATTSDGLHLPPASVIWSPYSQSQEFTSPGIYTNWVTVANPSDNYDGPCAVSNFVVVTVFKVEIIPRDGASLSGICVGTSAGYSAKVTPNSLTGSFEWTKGGSGLAALIGALNQDVSVQAGGAPSVSVGAETFSVKFTPGGSLVSSTDSKLMTVIKVETVSVDATADIGPTKINYKVLPSGASIPSVTFTAPGMTETRANVSSDLSFTYNQKYLSTGNNTIRLSHLSCQTDITANKQAVSKGPAEEIVIATYPENEDPPVFVNIPITHKIISEGYWRISYSGAPVVPGSRTLHVGSTSVKVQVPETRNISWVLEKHRYNNNDGDYCEKVMSLFTGASLPPTTDYRKFYDSSDDDFFKPGCGMTGIAQLDAMAFEDSGNIVQPVNIDNEEVDQSME